MTIFEWTPGRDNERLHTKLSEKPGDNHDADYGGKHSRRRVSPKKPHRGKLLAWVGGLASSAIVAFVAAFATVLGTQAASPAAGSSLTPLHGGPILVTLGNVTGADGSMALPKPLILGAKDLAVLTAAANGRTYGYQAWLAAHNMAFAGLVNIQIVVQGNRHHTVRIINVKPVETCSAPLSGTMFFAPGQGADTSARLYVNLDNPQLPAEYSRPPSEKKYPNYFGQYSVSLGFGQQFTFQVTASTSRHFCQFELQLTALDDGKMILETVNDHGKPFRLTPIPAGGGPIFSNYKVLYLDSEIARSYFPKITSPAPWVKVNPNKFNW
jgi:hypothetical protein